MRSATRSPRAGVVAVAALTLAVAGCDLGMPAGRSPHREGNRLDMIDQPKFTPQRADVFGGRPTSVLEPPAGSVAADETPYPYQQADAARAGAELVNPLQATPAVLAHGKFVYENICITCHGPKGAGDGLVTSLFPKPPSLMTQRVRDWPDGEIFHRPMRGQGSMPSHARQVDARDTWSVVLYIRQMQSQEPVAPAAVPAAAPPAAPSASASQGPSGSTPTPASPVPGGQS